MRRFFIIVLIAVLTFATGALVEPLMRAPAFKSSPQWTHDEMAKFYTPEALTSVVCSSGLIHEKISRVLSPKFRKAAI